jgi:hypothetical protein
MVLPRSLCVGTGVVETGGSSTAVSAGGARDWKVASHSLTSSNTFLVLCCCSSSKFSGKVRTTIPGVDASAL